MIKPTLVNPCCFNRGRRAGCERQSLSLCMRMWCRFMWRIHVLACFQTATTNIWPHWWLVTFVKIMIHDYDHTVIQITRDKSWLIWLYMYMINLHQRPPRPIHTKSPRPKPSHSQGLHASCRDAPSRSLKRPCVQGPHGDVPTSKIHKNGWFFTIKPTSGIRKWIGPYYNYNWSLGEARETTRKTTCHFFLLWARCGRFRIWIEQSPLIAIDKQDPARPGTVMYSGTLPQCALSFVHCQESANSATNSTFYITPSSNCTSLAAGTVLVGRPLSSVTWDAGSRWRDVIITSKSQLSIEVHRFKVLANHCSTHPAFLSPIYQYSTNKPLEVYNSRGKTLLSAFLTNRNMEFPESKPTTFAPTTSLHVPAPHFWQSSAEAPPPIETNIQLQKVAVTKCSTMFEWCLSYFGNGSHYIAKSLIQEIQKDSSDFFTTQCYFVQMSCFSSWHSIRNIAQVNSVLLVSSLGGPGKAPQRPGGHRWQASQWICPVPGAKRPGGQKWQSDRATEASASFHLFVSGFRPPETEIVRKSLKL